ncbi:hypothetical protein KUF71_010412 [Frankliniella fusca]|uniref:RNA-directed DNA polymerase n=1 Tax=Frankliniella fusca TaxID=407009 RepID=A0AAE1HH03_9NEOP|nr:hypothetical protein KUF71_010412 [Frankliniella fusca]
MGVMHNVPPALSFTGNVTKNFRDWKKLFDNYMRATHQMECKDEEKIATLFNVAGREAVLKQDKILKGLTAEEQKDYTKVLSALKKYCESLYEYNETYERFIFSRRAQQEGETFENFYQAIQELVVSCNYPDQSKQLRDRIVQGIRDKALQESLLRIKNLTEDVAAQQARTTEISRTQVMNMAKCGIGAESSNTIVVDSMKNRRTRKKKNNQGSNNVSNPNPISNPNSNPNPKKNNPPTSGEPPKGKFRCIKCDTFHGKGKCPAFGQTCGKCNKPNHLTKCCRMEIKQVAELRTHEDDDDVVVLHSLQCLDTKNEWRELIKIGNRHVVMKLDPGAHCNTLTWEIVKTLQERKNMRSCSTVISPYGTNSPPIRPVGKILLNVEVRGKQEMLDFLVVDDDVTPVLSKQDCERFGLVIRVHEIKTKAPQTKEEFINSHKEQFQGTGKFPGKLKIVLQDACKPKRSIPHRIPSAIRDRLKQALDDQEARGIIRKVKEITPATVINNLVITEKPDNSLRICLDPSELNKVVLSRPHPVPTTLEIQEKLSGMKVFSVLDLKEGFYHCELDEESQMLYRLKRLRLKILKYKFDTEYLPGTSMHMADHLSRNFLPETEVEDPEMVEVVHSITRKLPVSKSYLEKLLAASEKDLVIKQVIQYVMEGWPAQISKVPQEVKPFWQHQADLHVLDGVLLKGNCIVIPNDLQKETLTQLHEGHAASEKTIKRAKMSVYWPNYVRDITNFVDNCEVCGKFKSRKPPVELMQHDIPDLPWAKLGMDLSAAQILYSRQIKTALPTSRETLQPKLVQAEAHKKMTDNQQARKTSYDKKATRRPQMFTSGQVVNIRNRHEKTWTPGTIVGKDENPRSYLVKNSKGNVVRRNERHIHKAGTTLDYQSDYSDIALIEIPQQPLMPEPPPLVVNQEPETTSEFVLIVPDYFFNLQ